jgi:hypothetical protein
MRSGWQGCRWLRWIRKTRRWEGYHISKPKLLLLALTELRCAMVAQIAAAVGDTALLAHLAGTGFVTLPLAGLVGTADCLRKRRRLRNRYRNGNRLGWEGIMPFAVNALLSTLVSRKLKIASLNTYMDIWTTRKVAALGDFHWK